MENTILNKYWQVFHDDKIKNYKELLEKMDFVEKILFCIVLIATLVAIIFDVLLAIGRIELTIGIAVMIFAMLIEFLGAIISNKYSAKLSAQRTFQEIRDIRVRFTEIHEWLKTMGFSRKAEIKQLTLRCTELFNEWEDEKKKSRDFIERVMASFYIPTLFAFVSWILSCNEETNNFKECVLLVLMVITFGTVIYCIINYVSNIIERISYSQAKKIKYMIKDFKGVMDYCFDSEDQDMEILN